MRRERAAAYLLGAAIYTVCFLIVVMWIAAAVMVLAS
jgi:hypothetical protein